ncbi:MAG: TolC family protein [Gemmatimonadetes bacterium]|nr:TolC family protein [Gemmatimonadota bacterium]
MTLIRASRGPFRRAAAVSATVVVAGALGCAPPSTIGGAPSVARTASTVWHAPADAGRAPEGAASAPSVTGPVPLPASARDGMSLADLVSVALDRSPLTRNTWASARAAAAGYASASGKWLPNVSLDASGGPARAISANPAFLPTDRTLTTATLSVQYLLWDFGARGGTQQAAHEALYVADFTHNSTVQAVVLAAEGAYFNFQASRGLLDAARATVKTAQTNLAAAERRHDVGLATIADVLQARTALAQSELAAQTAEGNLEAARAQLALAAGLKANAPFEVVTDTGSAPLLSLAENVDSLIERAMRDRPDVVAARALARQSEAQVRVSRSLTLPTLTLGGANGQSFSNINALQGKTYALSLGVSVPLFTGTSRDYDLAAAKENAAAAIARAEQAQLLAASQVYTSYHTLRTSTQRVTTAAKLLASATQSEEVARGRYAEGVGSILDLLTAQSALADARAQHVQSRWTWYLALAQLARDVGVLSPRGDPNLAMRPDTAGRNDR